MMEFGCPNETFIQLYDEKDSSKLVKKDRDEVNIHSSNENLRTDGDVDRI